MSETTPEAQEQPAKKEPKALGPRRFYSFQYGVDELHDEGIFTNLVECIEKTQIAQKDSPREHEWVMVETEVNKWIKCIREHPEPTAFFALVYETGTIMYWGDFPNYDAAVANRAEKDPNELQFEILHTDKLREWKTESSEGPKMKLIPD